MSNESIKQKSKEPTSNDDTNTKTGSMSPLNSDQSSTNSREMLNNFQEGLMAQERNLMSPVIDQVELRKSNRIKKILSKYEDFIMTIENLK